MPDDPPVLVETDEGTVRVLTLNRPQVHNAINPELAERLEAAIARAATDDARAVVITGAGASFCSGSDVGPAGRTAMSVDTRIRRMHQLMTTLYRYPKPTVAAVNGLALGGGLELAMACDLRVAVPSARLGLPEIRIGLIASYGGTALLPRLVGEARALELMISGTPITADVGLQWGLVSGIAEPGSVLTDAIALATRCGQHSAVPHQALKRLLRPEQPHASLAQALDAERHEAIEVGGSEDAREGVAAFLEKRAPSFKDR